MATLHKFKLLATQCAVAGSPGRSPSSSPVVHLRRRKTLRMLLNRSSATHRRRFHRDQDDPPPPSPPQSPTAQTTSNSGVKKKTRRKLKELFVASPPFEERDSNGNRNRNNSNKSCDCEEGTEDLLPVTVNSGDGFSSRGSNSLRTFTASFRYRLLRRAWRPMLVTIPE